MSQLETSKLYIGDNLSILREHIPDESVDLIYLDPPFNSSRDYNLNIKGKAQITAFKDTWHWTQESARTLEQLKFKHGELAELLDLMVRQFGHNDLSAYLVMMAIRLVELHRVLKPTGSLYLHCDPTASHYLKMILDMIFGAKKFRNEIVWCYRKWSVAQTQFVRNHDVILFYSRSKQNIFNTLFVPVSQGTMRRWKGSKQQAVFVDGVRQATSSEGETAQSPMPDWWEISVLNPNSKERLGYPTQKPLALLERIIQASSNPGDVVLDPFCGCGGAVHAAQKLGRQWIGIDITHLAIALIEKRLKDAFPGIQFTSQ